MQMGGASPETCVTILSMQNAPPPPGDKSLVLPSVRESLGITAKAIRMRRKFGPVCNSARRDVKLARENEDAYEIPQDGDALEARVAYSKAKNGMAKEEKRAGQSK